MSMPKWKIVPVAVPWVVQVSADRVLAIEGLDRPSVGGANLRAVGDDSSLGELRTRPRRSRSVGQEGEGGDEDGGGCERPATPADVCGDGVHAVTVRRGSQSVAAHARPSNRPLTRYGHRGSTSASELPSVTGCMRLAGAWMHLGARDLPRLNTATTRFPRVSGERSSAAACPAGRRETLDPCARWNR